MIITHMLGEHVSVVVANVEIARYVYRPDPNTFEAPKPYFHPLRSLAGDVVTGYRPHDHRWHKGLQLTCTDLSGTNLWGGNTYVDGSGYLPLDVVGMMRLDGDVSVTATPAESVIEHDLLWCSATGDVLITEHRTLRVHRVDVEAGAWSLEWVSVLRNESLAALSFGSPATRGLTGSGYSGLFWRGPRSFTDGRIVSPGGSVTADAFRGRSATWLAFSGEHDEADRASTVVIEDMEEHPRFETGWFVRSEEFAALNPSWAFHRPFTLDPEAEIPVAYTVTIANGAWDRDRVERWRASTSP